MKADVVTLEKAGTSMGAKKAWMKRPKGKDHYGDPGFAISPGKNPDPGFAMKPGKNMDPGFDRSPESLGVKKYPDRDWSKRGKNKSLGGGNVMEAIIKTIDEEYFDKCMDAGMMKTWTPQAREAALVARKNRPHVKVFGDEDKGDKVRMPLSPDSPSRKKDRPQGSNVKVFGERKDKEILDKPWSSNVKIFKSLAEWRMSKGSIAPSAALGEKSSKTVESQTGGSDTPTGYGDRDGDKKLRNTKKKAGKLSGGKKLGENVPEGSAY